MYAKKRTILNPTGLHARPASEFCKLAGTFQSDITILRADLGEGETSKRKEGNAKSVISVMAMGLPRDSIVEIRAEGEDEMAAVEALSTLIDSGFGEI